MTELTVASFFSGVGLLDLGLEWAGWRTVSVSEIDPYASRILSLRFPDAPNLGDIHGITDLPPATLWAGGFPCQPVSTAGKRRAQDDSRWLWPRWVELIRESRPPFLLLENVSNLLAVNGGRAFGDVLRDLAASGYDAEWDCVPAAALGAPHLRDRVWIVAYLPDAIGRGVRHEPESVERGGGSADPVHDGAPRPVADAHESGRGASERGVPEGQPDPCGGRSVAYSESAREGRLHLRPGRPRTAEVDGGRREPRSEGPIVWRLPQPDPRRHGSGNGWWGAEPGLGRVVDGVPHRVDRLRCLGNGVVPQVAEFIGWRLRAAVEVAS